MQSALINGGAAYLALALGRDFSVWNAPARLLQLADVYGVEVLIPAAQTAPSR